MCRARILIIVLLITAVGCGGSGSASQPTSTTRPLPSPTGTSVPTETPPPSPTVEPSPTSSPTEAPTRVVFTSTPTPTSTVAPTPTETTTPAATPTEVVALTPLENLSAGRTGEEVTVEGRVVETASFSHGFKFTLDDGTDQIILLMWHDVYDDCWDAAQLNLGARVRATGEVGEYEGELQLEPGFGGDVKALEGATAETPKHEIGALSGEYEGQRVMIEGEVARVEGLPSAVKVHLGDDTGSVVVFIWRNVLDRIADNTALGTEGSRLRVVGEVAKYEGNLEVIPTLPNDVTVLEMP